MARDISNSDDVIDSRDVIERIEELESERDEFILNETQSEDSISWGELSEEQAKANEKWDETEEGIELKNLTDFMEEFKGYGGDEQWRGDWYPITLVHEDYWEDYCSQELEDLGYIPKDFPSWIEIDFTKTAENMRQGYTSGEFDGVTYWAR